VVNVSGPSHPWSTDLETFYKVTSSTWGAALVVPMMTAFIKPEGLSDQIASIFAPQSMPEGFESFVGVGLSLKRTALRANASHRATLLGEITAMQPRYGAFSVPLEIVHGEADTTVGVKIHAEKMLRETDHARLEALAGIGHMPHHVSTAEVVAAIDRAAARAVE
jgi:pimeloyl-ACP methyl ester carboxylesterase